MNNSPISTLMEPGIQVWAWCAGKDGGPPCDHRAKLDIAMLFERWGDITVDQLRGQLKCRCGAGATISISNDGRPG